MAQIRRVVYTELPGQAKQIREKAGQLQSQLQSAYQSVREMRTNWYGQRYNDLVAAFNSMITDFNQIVDLMYREVPFTLETIANNYSRVDRGLNIISPDNTPAQKLAEIPVSTEEGMRFNTAEVESVKAKCNSCFSDVLNFLNDLQTLINNLSWESDASDKFREEFQKLKLLIIQYLILT